MLRRLPRSTRTDTRFPYTTLFRSGSAGVRYVNTWGSSNSFNFRPGDASNGFQDIGEESPGRGNYTDILPSFTALLHFTPKLRLRLSYTTNEIGRAHV